MKFKRFSVAFSITLMFGCSGTGWDDWSSFDAFKTKDVNGEKIDCDALVSTSMERSSSYESYEDYNVYLHDYLYKSQHKFSQCASQISDYVDDYCSRNASQAASTYLNNTYGDSPPRAFGYLCRSYLVAELAKVDSRYELPNENSDYIILHDAGKMLKPKSIAEISFNEPVRDALWKITLRTYDNKAYSLYFGDKSKWELAKLDFARSTSNLVEAT